MSQEQFARHLGKSYGMVQRYEQKRAPAGPALVYFIDLAVRSGFPDLAESLNEAMCEHLRGDVKDSANPTAQVGVVPTLSKERLYEALSKQSDAEEQALRSLWFYCLRTLPKPSIRVLTSVMIAEAAENGTPWDLLMNLISFRMGDPTGMVVNQQLEQFLASQKKS